MARTREPNQPDDESTFYRRGGNDSRRAPRTADDSSALDARLLDIDDEEEEESPFLRAQKRVPVRRGGLAKRTRGRVLLALAALVAVLLLAAAAYSVSHYAKSAARFRVDSSDNIELAGTEHVSRAEILAAIAGDDIGRNIFRISLDENRHKLMAIPWVESATVMRLLPNHLRIIVKERTPVASVNLAGRVMLIDTHGVLMDISASDKQVYSFPVILGMTENDPLSMRLARISTYTALMKELDSGGANYSHDVNEVDVSDPDDAQITVADSNGAVLIHLGHEHWLERYKLYISKVQEIRAQVQKLDSVDLRYEGELVVNPDHRAAPASQPQVDSASPVEKPAAPKPEAKAEHKGDARKAEAKKEAKLAAAKKHKPAR